MDIERSVKDLDRRLTQINAWLIGVGSAIAIAALLGVPYLIKSRVDAIASDMVRDQVAKQVNGRLDEKVHAELAGALPEIRLQIRQAVDAAVARRDANGNDIESLVVSKGGTVRRDQDSGNIVAVHLFECDIGDDFLKNFIALPTLEHINLQNTNISNAGLAFLKTLPNLKSVDVRRTLVTKQGVDEWRATLQHQIDVLIE